MQPTMLFSVSIIMFLFIFLFGFQLRRQGKPYQVIPFNLHKFLCLGLLVVFILQVYPMGWVWINDALKATLIILIGLLYLGLIVTGGLSSALKDIPPVITLIHKIAPYLTLLLVVVFFFVLPG